MLQIIGVALALVAAGIVYFLITLRKKRAELNGCPQPPMTNWLLGHLEIAGECRRIFPNQAHVHNWARYIQKKYNMGDFFYVDWWPLGPRWLFMSDPELISQYVTTAQNLPKSILETAFLDKFLGDSNMVSIEGEKWKTQRSMFNPGFSTAHLMTLVPYIVDSSLVFCDVINQKAKTNHLFQLEGVGTHLTIDIIGKVVLDSDFDSQKALHPIVETFRARAPLMPAQQAVLDTTWIEFRRRFRLWRNGRELDRLIGEELDRKMAARFTSQNGHANGSATKPPSKDRKRSVVDLALDAYEKQFPDQRFKPGQPMNKFFRSTCIDSMKTFIFAGHDTTASTIAYIFYFLHTHPTVHDKMAAELDSVFGPGASATEIADRIKSDSYITNNLPYMLAVIKETLRLFPPASTLRFTSTPGLVFPMPGEPTKKMPLSGYDIWPIIALVHRNEKFFPEPLKFVPERFLPNQTPYPDSLLHTPTGKDAWRPFEKGPRSCIGEQLAMLETKVILALTVKDFDFVAEYDNGPIHSCAPVESADELPGKADRRDKGEEV